MIDRGFTHFATRQPDAPALVDPAGRLQSRGALLAAINRNAQVLRRQGLRPHDTLAILSPNCAEFVASYLAAIESGLYVVPINWHLAPAEIAYVLENSGATALLAHERLAPLVARVLATEGSQKLTTRVAFGHIDGFSSLEKLAATASATAIASPVLGRVLLYTSATTGRPKAIQVPLHDSARALARTIDFHMASGIGLEGGHVHLCSSMLYHAAPLEFVAIALHMGHTVVLTDRWDAEQQLRLIQQHRVTTSFMVPAMFIRLLKLPTDVRSRYDTTSLQLVAHSAAPCPEPIKRQIIQWWGPVVWESYGAAEGVGTAVNSTQWLERPGTVGRAIAGTTLRILDDDGNELPPGQVGSIYFSRFTGDRFEYKNDPEKTRAAYRDGLFSVGDVGYVDADGYLFVCDRKIDMIICAGMNIYSAEVEQLLVQHPQVLDCAVFGIPDELSGETVCAVVQPMPGVTADAALTADIGSFLRNSLSPIKVPRRIDYAQQLPRDPNGKLYKRKLREHYWQGLRRNI